MIPGLPRSIATTFAALGVLVSAFPLPGMAQSTFYGPLTAEEGGPLQRISFTHMSEVADLVGRGRLQLDLWNGYSNIFEQDSADSHELFLDLERVINTVGLRYGVAERLEVGGRLTFETTGGGVLDAFISGWHGHFGLGNANRDRYPQNGYEQLLSDADGTVRIDIERRTLALEEARLYAKWSAWKSEDARKTLVVRGAVRLPVRDNRVGDERADGALMVLGRVSWEKWHVHGVLGGSTVRAGPELAAILRRSAWFGTLAGERALDDWVSLVVQYSLSTPRIRGIGDSEIDGWPGNLIFGLSGRMGSSWRWDASFQEDIPPGSPAVDFTLGLRLSRIW